MAVALAVASVALMVVSLSAYRRRSEGRYLILAVAFICLCAISVSTVFLELIVGLGPTTVQGFELYVIPGLELVMVISFLTALLWSTRLRRQMKVAFPVAIAIVGALVIAAYASSTGAGISSALPSDCVRPADGYLIVASSLGYNDSVMHGAPAQSWPVLDISQGSEVTITICNTYQQAVGFQVVHYLQDKIQTVLPGQAITVSFVASQLGTFNIYCSILCPIHLFLQSGMLRVVS